MRVLLRCAVSRALARLLIMAVMASTMPVEASYGVRERRLVTQDELGNRLVQRDANGHETRFEYDKLGREVARVLPDGARESKTYDAAGSLDTWTDFIGRTTTFGYDVNSRLTGKLFHTGRSVGFTYSVTGRRLTATDARGTTTFGYDNRDRLTSITQPGVGSLGFSYNANGARETMTATVGSDALTTTYGYDDANRLDTVQDHLGRTYDFDWDENGNRERLALPNGVATSYQYSPLNRLTQLSAAGPLGAVFSQAFTLGPAGNRTRIDELNGVSRVYGYDDLYRLTSETVNSGADLNYSRNWTYDAVGNRQQQVTAIGSAGTPGPNLQPGAVDYTYDSRDRLLTEVFGTATTTHSYDANGNLVTKSGELTLTWDEENRLIRMEKPDGTVIQTDYDADGVRVGTTTTLPGQAAEVVDFLVDTSGGLSHVVAEVTVAGLRAVYVRGGDDLLSVVRPSTTTASGWESRFYTSDGIGSIRNLTDETGAVTDTYSTTAFGELLGHQGSDPQPYLFAGEPYDPNAGLAYHRARWMEPGTGRFLGMDPFEGLRHDPDTLHRYTYVAGNPTNSIDPTGECGCSVGGFLTAAGIGAVLYSIAAPRPATFRQAAATALRGAVIGAALYTGFAAAAAAVRLFMSLSVATGAAIVPAGGGRVFTHFTDAQGVSGITGIAASELTVGVPMQVGRLAFGPGQNAFLAPQAGAIFVTQLGPAASSGQLQQIGVFGARQQFAIQFAEEIAFSQGSRVVGVLVERSIYAMSPTQPLLGSFVVTRRF